MVFLILLFLFTFVKAMDSPLDQLDYRSAETATHEAEKSSIDKAKEQFIKIGCAYPIDFDLHSPLPPELVVNSYWKAMKNEDDETKNNAIDSIITTGGDTFETYYLCRPHIAAAAMIGSSKAFYCGFVLALFYKDEELAKSLMRSQQKNPEDVFVMFKDNHDFQKLDEESCKAWIRAVRESLEQEKDE